MSSAEGSDSEDSYHQPQQSTRADGFDINSNDAQSMVSDMVQYAITHSQNKYPIKRANISKDCLPKKSRIFAQIFKSANENLDKYFGMKMIEVPHKPNTQQYILVNALKASEIPIYDKPNEDYLLNGILIPVLAVIFMMKGETKEEIIYGFLKTIGLDVESNKKIGPLNYTLKQLLTHVWVKQLYLEYFKVGEGDDQYSVFNWGFRADHEIDKSVLLTFVSSVYDAQVSPETWHEQFAMAHNRIGDDDTAD